MSTISVPTIDNDELAAWAEKDAINQVYASKITKYLEQAQTHSEVISRKREASDNATQLLTEGTDDLAKAYQARQLELKRQLEQIAQKAEDLRKAVAEANAADVQTLIGESVDKTQAMLAAIEYNEAKDALQKLQKIAGDEVPSFGNAVIPSVDQLSGDRKVGKPGKDGIVIWRPRFDTVSVDGSEPAKGTLSDVAKTLKVNDVSILQGALSDVAGGRDLTAGQSYTFGLTVNGTEHSVTVVASSGKASE